MAGRDRCRRRHRRRRPCPLPTCPTSRSTGRRAAATAVVDQAPVRPGARRDRGVLRQVQGGPRSCSRSSSCSRPSARWSSRSRPTRWIWGFPFAAGFVAAAVRPRDGPRDRAAPRGHQGQCADVRPVPGRGRGRQVARRQRHGRGARRPRRPDPRQPSAPPPASSIWHATGNDIWRALAYTGFFLNLFNLLPVVPLDGGRAMAAMAPWMWVVGFVGADPAGVRVLQPDHADHPAVRRARDLPPAASSGERPSSRRSPTTRSSHSTASWSPRST